MRRHVVTALLMLLCAAVLGLGQASPANGAVSRDAAYARCQHACVACSRACDECIAHCKSMPDSIMKGSRYIEKIIKDTDGPVHVLDIQKIVLPLEQHPHAIKREQQ